MLTSTLVSLAVAIPALAAPSTKRDSTPDLLTDINAIQKHWGEITPYHENDATLFGVENVGLPDGCAYEQVHILHRHGSRYPTGYPDDADVMEDFAAKVVDIIAATGNTSFMGPLSFLNTYTYLMGESILVPTGAAQDYTSGANFWNTRGRLLYDAIPGQAYYNATATNGTARPLPLLRTTSQERILDSALAWAGGFFGVDAEDQYDMLIIPEGGTENNTLASYDECYNSDVDSIDSIGDNHVFDYIPLFLEDATDRLNTFLVDGQYSFNVNDTYGMMTTCAYEYNALGSSDFCDLFTEAEWKGYEYCHDLEYYYDYGYGNPTGRAQGIGYVQELMARINDQYITVGNTSVNVTLDSDPATFPLGQRFYMDMTHDDIIVSVLSALSVDYFKEDLPVSQVPPPADRRFKLSDITPFGTRMYTEVIGCNSATPAEKTKAKTVYTREQNGYDASTATHKFVRMVLNGAIIPLTTIEGGACASGNSNRTDGLCAMEDFKASQAGAEAKANYQYSCWGNYTGLPAGWTGDGAAFAR